MSNLIGKLLNILPFPLWMANNNKIIYINNYFSNKLNVELSKINILENKIIVLDDDNELVIPKENNSKIVFRGKKYSHIIIMETINEKVIEIGMLLDEDYLNEDYLNDKDIENSSKILKTVIDNVTEIIFYKDKAGIYKGANKKCLEFYNSCGVTELIGKTDIELPLDRKFIEICTKHDSIVLKHKKPIFMEEEHRNMDGSIDIFETVKTPIINSNSEVLGIVGVARNITNRKVEERKLRYLSYTDVLTGLYNRAFFDEKINELMKNNKSFPIGVIMGDVNGLKLVNDTFGHVAGDNLIIKTANIIKSACENNELIFRWGGDEFIILIPKGSEYICENLINKIKIDLSNNKNKSLSLNMAMGYSIIRDCESSIDNALKEAENKLYREKILVGKSIRSSIISTLQASLQAKNIETLDHTNRVLNYSLKIGEYLNLNNETIAELTLLAKLHDIGKIAIPENILLKQSKLTYDEEEIMKTHSEKGYRLVMTLPELSHIARGILTHHERWDGTGYPLGISGNEIPLVARIVSIVDAYDEMINGRECDKVKTKSEAIEELQRGSGYQFDPKITEIFCRILKEEKSV